ncbi:MAG TPA: hypothetical protein VFT74_00155, partial [Isosphaeraceae bacterium]|nr:hypothetical protein [Isosphaeraceae bacterium]
MFLNKYPYPANFAFPEAFDSETGCVQIGGASFEASLLSFEGDVYRVRVSNREVWPEYLALQPPTPPSPSSRQRLRFTDGFGLELIGDGGQPLLRTAAGCGFGISGEASLFQFVTPEGARFYGQGEKDLGEFELSGYRTKFWNTDVWGDFHWAQWGSNPVDPPYFTTPYLVLKSGDEYVGLLLDNPYPTFIETPGKDETRIFVEWQRTSPHVIMGSEGGEANLWVIYGPSLRDLTRKL